MLAFLGGQGESAKARTPKEAAPRGDGYDSDNDLEHAQVVVLKEGKHLSKEQFMEESKKQEAPPPEVEKVAAPKAAPHKSRTKVGAPPGSTMEHAKNLIQAHRDEKRPQDGHQTPEPKRRKKAKVGAGLSFDIDDA